MKFSSFRSFILTLQIWWGLANNLFRLKLNEFVQNKQENIVFCRYGCDYLNNFNYKDSSFPIGSYKINLDSLIYSKQKML